MNLWMYGLGAEPEKGAALLKNLGFSTVAGSVACIEPAKKNGMDAWLFSSTYRGPEFKGEEWLARDIHDTPVEWFGSTCPNREEVRKYNLESIAKLASTPHVDGLLIDGCRFASPSSGKTTDAFYTCFCECCMRKARKLGFDPEKMKRSVSGLYDFMHGAEKDLLPLAEGLEEWMEFRRVTTTEHLINYCHVVHETSGHVKAGIFIFAPSLAKLVGQNYRDLRGIMDLYSPMLYRCYQDANGPACLNVEIADLLRMLGQAAALTSKQRIAVLRSLVGLEIEDEATPESIFKGFSPEVLKIETIRAKNMSPGAQLVPIIQLDDPDIETATRKTLEGGADAVSYFLYCQEWMEEREDAFRNLLG